MLCYTRSEKPSAPEHSGPAAAVAAVFIANWAKNVNPSVTPGSGTVSVPRAVVDGARKGVERTMPSIPIPFRGTGLEDREGGWGSRAAVNGSRPDGRVLASSTRS